MTNIFEVVSTDASLDCPDSEGDCYPILFLSGAFLYSFAPDLDDLAAEAAVA